jgi:phosphoribosylamine--glycine ligase
MKVLLVGGGAREHAMAAALKRGDCELYTVMKNRNPGIARLSEEVLLAPETEVEKVRGFAERTGVELAAVGPESPLSVGVADALEDAGVATMGPLMDLARIESSKRFMRDLMAKYHVPAAVKYGTFTDYDEAVEFLEGFGGEAAIKPDGLTGGKGVKVMGEHLKDLGETKEYIREIIEEEVGGRGGVVIEERCLGEEFTVQAFVDGTHVVPMPAVQDHKRAYEGDVGHNTGGMGSYSDRGGLLPFVTQKDYDEAVDVIKKTVSALKEETGKEYKGILYGQFMKGHGLKLIEFNCRFGDPEAMNVLTLLESDFVEICRKITEGSLSAGDCSFKDQATVCKYVVPVGYGVGSKGGQVLEVDEKAISDMGAVLYYAAVDERDGQIYTTSSRSLGLVGTADTIEEAERISEGATAHVRGQDIYHRTDIGTRDLIERKLKNMEQFK